MTIQVDLFGNIVYNARCKWCGKPFNKPHNRSMYCSPECALNNRREIKARYQRKRRLSIKKGLLVLSEKQRYGLGSYGTSHSNHRKESFESEYLAIQKEKRRIGITY